MTTGAISISRGFRQPPLRVQPWRAPLNPYLVALLLSAAALVASLVLAPQLGIEVPVFFLAAVAVSGWYGGLRPALASTLASALALDYFFEVPAYDLEISHPRTALSLLVFLLLAVLLGSLNGRLRAAKHRAEAAALARDELLVTVSHDLRTPLTVLKTAVSTLRDPAARVPAAVRQQLLDTIEDAADQLIRYVGSALALSRLEGGVAPDQEWNALDEIVVAALERCGPALRDRAASVAVPDNLPLMRFDAVLLEQSLGKLLDNVSQHTPPGTPFSIGARVVGADLWLEVSDAGPGIPHAQRERIFARYERLGNSNHGAGAGLGLAIARAAVQAQGGQVWVEDSPSGGARFVIHLPRVLPARTKGN
jgi:K+-sensing histidine kinase KdpD